MRWLALLLILLIVPSAFATVVTVDIYGTNVSNAQSNITKTGNNSYQIVQWAEGDTTKSLKADINGNASDNINFTIHNFTAERVIEVKVNSSSYNAYQADSTGTISFIRTQTVRNQTYSFTPAVNAGGYNQTWAWFWGNLSIRNYILFSDGTKQTTAASSALRTVVNVTANYTIGTSNTTGTMFTCYADSGTLNLTLPTGVVGTEFTIKKKDSSTNICEIYSGQNIDGAIRANISVQYNSIDLIYTDEWSIV